VTIAGPPAARIDPSLRPARWHSVQVCRGCCCGSLRKHPEVDHDAQLATWRRAAAVAGTRLHVTGCQGLCSHSNLVTLRHRRHRLTLGGVLTLANTAAVAAWIAEPTRPPFGAQRLVVEGAIEATLISLNQPVDLSAAGAGRPEAAP
jgi:hypothetical protein